MESFTTHTLWKHPNGAKVDQIIVESALCNTTPGLTFHAEEDGGILDSEQRKQNNKRKFFWEINVMGQDQNKQSIALRGGKKGERAMQLWSVHECPFVLAFYLSLYYNSTYLKWVVLS